LNKSLFLITKQEFMRVVILGAGCVASHLTRALLESAINLTQIYNRTIENAQSIAKEYNLSFTDKISQIHKADLYIIATTDDSIEEISYHIPFDDALVVHTAGSLGTDVLKGDYRKGVLYPMQSFTTTKAIRYEDVPFLIETDEESDYEMLEKLLKKISFKVFRTTAAQRAKMQLAKVIVSEIVTYMYSKAEELSADAGLPYESLHPVINETSRKGTEQKPFETLAQAIFLSNEKMLEKHFGILLPGDPFYQVYEGILTDIRKKYAKEEV